MSRRHVAAVAIICAAEIAAVVVPSWSARGEGRETACVSKEEFWQAAHEIPKLPHGIRVPALARRWGVAGYGVDISVEGPPVWSYPRCGYDHATRQGEVIVDAGRGGRVWAIALAKVTGP